MNNRKKTAGIFTYMQTNYGAILQAFALQSFLRDNNVEAEIVDFTTEEHISNQKLVKWPRTGNAIKSLILFFMLLLKYQPLKRRKTRTVLFKKKYFCLSKRYSTPQALLLSPPLYNLYISGSDQVFRVDSDYYRVYYLDFEKNKSASKIAYAASFGVSTFNKSWKTIIKPLLADFDFISCREKEGADFLSDIMGYEIPQVVDPVFLHDSFFWNRIACKPTRYHHYIFVYDLNGGNALINIAKKIKRETSLPIVCLTRNIYQRYGVDYQIYDSGPSEFLGWIGSADYVITDSFHGTAFSMIFKKKFYSYIAVPSTASRIYGILKLFNLQDKIIDYNDKRDLLCNGTWDYTACNIKIAINDSKRFLLSTIK